jgi:hypothetical protein
MPAAQQCTRYNSRCVLQYAANTPTGIGATNTPDVQSCCCCTVAKGYCYKRQQIQQHSPVNQPWYGCTDPSAAHPMWQAASIQCTRGSNTGAATAQHKHSTAATTQRCNHLRHHRGHASCNKEHTWPLSVSACSHMLCPAPPAGDHHDTAAPQLTPGHTAAAATPQINQQHMNPSTATAGTEGGPYTSPATRMSHMTTVTWP